MTIFVCIWKKKVFVKYMGKTFNQLYYWPQRWHFWEIEGSCLMKFPSEECFKICQFFWNILCYFNFFPKEYPGVFQHRSSGQLCVENNDTWDCTLQKNLTNSWGVRNFFKHKPLISAVWQFKKVILNHNLKLMKCQNSTDVDLTAIDAVKYMVENIVVV